MDGALTNKIFDPNFKGWDGTYSPGVACPCIIFEKLKSN
jgi:hypothetical protein